MSAYGSRDPGARAYHDRRCPECGDAANVWTAHGETAFLCRRGHRGVLASLPPAAAPVFPLPPRGATPERERGAS